MRSTSVLTLSSEVISSLRVPEHVCQVSPTGRGCGAIGSGGGGVYRSPEGIESKEKRVVFRVFSFPEHFRIFQKSFLMAGPVNSIDT